MKSTITNIGSHNGTNKFKNCCLMPVLFLIVFILSSVMSYAQPGTLDNTFGSGGIVTTNAGGDNYSFAQSVAIQSDGKIVAAGYDDNGSGQDFALTRYNTDGSLDNTFGSGGIVTTNAGGDNSSYAQSVAIQSDGKIVAAGQGGN